MIMEKGTIVYLDNDNDPRRMGEVDRLTVIGGDEYCIMSSVMHEGAYTENCGLDDDESLDAGLAFPAGQCTAATEEDCQWYERHRYDH